VANQGTITINNDGGTAPASLFLNGLSGGFFAINGKGGSILLNAGADPSSAQLNGNADHPIFLTDRSQSVHGTGQINIPIENNDGSIVADVPGRSLVIRRGIISNSSMIGASGGGLLDFDGTASADIMAVNGGSTASTMLANGGKIRFLGNIAFFNNSLTSANLPGNRGRSRMRRVLIP
jgi:hypothetical protein